MQVTNIFSWYSKEFGLAFHTSDWVKSPFNQLRVNNAFWYGDNSPLDKYEDASTRVCISLRESFTCK